MRSQYTNITGRHIVGRTDGDMIYNRIRNTREYIGGEYDHALRSIAREKLLWSTGVVTVVFGN